MHHPIGIGDLDFVGLLQSYSVIVMDILLYWTLRKNSRSFSTICKYKLLVLFKTEYHKQQYLTMQSVKEELLQSSIILFPVPSLLVNALGLELQLGTAKEVSGGCHYQQITVPSGQLGRDSLTRTVTSKKVKHIITIEQCLDFSFTLTIASFCGSLPCYH